MVEGKVIFGVDADIVHINLQPFFHYHIGEDVVHKGLECRWCIAKPEEHHCWFKKSQGDDKGSFPLVFFMNVDVVIAHLMLNFVKKVASFMSMMSLGMSGRGYTFRMV